MVLLQIIDLHIALTCKRSSYPLTYANKLTFIGMPFLETFTNIKSNITFSTLFCNFLLTKGTFSLFPSFCSIKNMSCRRKPNFWNYFDENTFGCPEFFGSESEDKCKYAFATVLLKSNNFILFPFTKQCRIQALTIAISSKFVNNGK